MAPSGRPPQRQIHNLLIANRGEIATRLLTTARELNLKTYALRTDADDSHTYNAHHVLSLPSASSYLDIPTLVSLIKANSIGAVHPGYGFLSESPEFAQRAWEEAGCVVVGPGWEALARTGDKLQARELARECGVPVLPATSSPTSSVDEIKRFAEGEAGLPIMLKAVDGGGGRGIRLVREMKDLEGLAKRAMEESPSKQVFAEKAAVDGYRHVEVQVIGDGRGGVQHLWERECSIQRRYQKIVELAPSMIADRKLVAKIIGSAVAMARHIQYLSLGTFEFLANPNTGEFFFLEINPRLQVEHTITESISLVDLVKIQLEIAQGFSLKEASLNRSLDHNPEKPPPMHSVQLRVTAENVEAEWSLSIGKIQGFHFPSGNGLRVDTHLVSGHEAQVTADFDSLIAKIIVTAPTWPDVVRKCQRALQDTRIDGVKTNLDVLRGIVSSEAFTEGKCDTRWLESNVDTLYEDGKQIASRSQASKFASATPSSSGSIPGLSSSTVLLRKGDAWSIRITPQEDEKEEESVKHHMKLEKVMRNELPNFISAEVAYSASDTGNPRHFNIELSATSASSAGVANSEKHRKGDKSNPRHVIIPFPGKLVEVMVDVDDVVQQGDVVCVVQQMKMELEVRAGRTGRVVWITEAEDGEDIDEGILAAELEDVDESNSEARAKL